MKLRAHNLTSAGIFPYIRAHYYLTLTFSGNLDIVAYSLKILVSLLNLSHNLQAS